MAPHGVRTARRGEGFTLVEVMVAILLTAIAMIGILSLYMSQSRGSSFSRHMTEASVLASDGLERMRTITPPPASMTETNIDEQGQSPGRYDRVSTSVALPSGTEYDVQIVVSWDEDGDAVKEKSVIVNGRR